MRAYFEREAAPDNLWIGVTVEDKKHGLPRLNDLNLTNGKNKHICCEPLMENLGNIDLEQVSLVVGGGESGKNARRTKLNWVESLKHQCIIQNTHFYWKSWGNYDQDGAYRGNGKSGCRINGKEYLSFPGSFQNSVSKF